jgi:uridine kinase
MKPLMIAIGGGSGSGKTTVAKQIRDLLKSKDVVVIPLDNYYKDINHLPKEERDKINFDHPESFDWTLFKAHLNDLLKGRTIEVPEYSFKDHTRLKKTKILKPKKIIIFEGIFALCDKECNKIFNLRIFVETDSDLRFIIPLQRDLKERARSPENTIKSWIDNVKPMHSLFIEPSKRFAHVILPEHERGVSIRLIKEGIKGLVK